MGALGVNQRWLFTAVFMLGAALAGLGGALRFRASRRTWRSTSRWSPTPSWSWWSAAWARSRRVPRRAPHRRDQGVLHRPGLLEAHARRRVHRHGGGAGPAALGPARPPAGRARAGRSCPFGSSGGKLSCPLLGLLVPAAFRRLRARPPHRRAGVRLFAVSLHFLLGPGGMVSFGHAAYFGSAPTAPRCSCCAPACRWSCPALARSPGSPAPRCSAGSACGSPASTSRCSRWPSRRSCGRSPSSGTGDRRLQRPDRPLASGVAGLARRLLLRPDARALRARDRRALAHRRLALRLRLRAEPRSPLRAAAIGIDVRAQQWAAFIIAGSLRRAGRQPVRVLQGFDLARDASSVPRSVDGLVMVLLGGVQTLPGPVRGAALFTWLEDAVSREIEYWRACHRRGDRVCWCSAFPAGIAGLFKSALR